MLTWKIPQRGLLGSTRCWSTWLLAGRLGRRALEPHLAALHTDTVPVSLPPSSLLPPTYTDTDNTTYTDHLDILILLAQAGAGSY